MVKDLSVTDRFILQTAAETALVSNSAEDGHYNRLIINTYVKEHFKCETVTLQMRNLEEFKELTLKIATLFSNIYYHRFPILAQNHLELLLHHKNSNECLQCIRA